MSRGKNWRSEPCRGPVVSSETTKRSAMSVAEMVEVERRDKSGDGLRGDAGFVVDGAAAGDADGGAGVGVGGGGGVGGGAEGVGDVGWNGVDVGGEKDFRSRVLW